MISLLQSMLGSVAEGIRFELHGLDVADSGVQQRDFFAGTITKLQQEHPDVDWTQRLLLTDGSAAWPYPDDYFDFILSNQVLEHVARPDVLFANLRRCLAPDGFSAHLFPLRAVWWELHVKAPFAHWWRNGDLIESWLRFCSIIGLSTWRRYSRLVKTIALHDYARMNRDFIVHETNYLHEEEFAQLGKKHGLRYCLRYTEEFYLNRLRRLAGLSLNYRYQRRNALAHKLSTTLMKRVNSVTLVLERDNCYENIGLHTPGR